MTQRREIGPEGAAAEIVEARVDRRSGKPPDVRHERRGDALSVGLADDAEPHRGRDEVRDEGEAERLQGRLERDFVAGRRDADRDRVGDRRRPTLPSGGSIAGQGQLRTDRADEGVALRRRLEPALRGGRERQRELGDLGEPCAVAGAGGPVGRREQDGVVSGRAEGEKVCRASPRGSPRPSDHRPRAAHSSPCE